jgi:O-antigen ligase
VGHPHNDYLRLWHDLGLVGLGLFVLALASWGLILARGVYPAVTRGGQAAYMELAGLLALLALTLAIVTDNALVYPAVMAPMGILIGAGLGTGSHKRAAGRPSIYPLEQRRALASAGNPGAW